jgi:hypothetical protein
VLRSSGAGRRGDAWARPGSSAAYTRTGETSAFCASTYCLTAIALTLNGPRHVQRCCRPRQPATDTDRWGEDFFARVA